MHMHTASLGYAFPGLQTIGLQLLSLFRSQLDCGCAPMTIINGNLQLSLRAALATVL